MSPEEQEIVDRQAPVVAKILHPNGADATAPVQRPHKNVLEASIEGMDEIRQQFDAAPKPRRTRSDAGTKRTPKPEQPAGKLSGHQIAELDQLRDQMESDKFDYLKSQAAYYAFLDGIRAK